MKPIPIRLANKPDTLKQPSSNTFFNEFKKLLAQWKNGPSTIGRTYPLPIFEENQILKLLADVKEILKIQPPLIKRTPGIIIVGDLHGNLLNLLQIFATHGLPPLQKYIFLGNYVNFGQFSLEVVIFLFTLLYMFPSFITLLRGSCQFYIAKGERTLTSNIEQFYGAESSLKTEFMETFNYLPLAAQISNNVLCGRSSLFTKYDTIKEIYQESLPIPYVLDQNKAFFAGFASITPTDETLSQFMENNGLDYIIFGGKNVGTGIEKINDETCFALSADSYIGYAGIINFVGNQPPFSLVFTTDSMLLREVTLFENIQSNHISKIRPVIRSIKPERRQLVQPVNHQGVPGMSKLPCLSPQPLNLGKNGWAMKSH